MVVNKKHSKELSHFPVQSARRYFLQKAIELKPEIIDDLRGLAYPEYSISVFFDIFESSTVKKRAVQMPVSKTLRWEELISDSNGFVA
jgi:hypothetical protein